ncbi:MAG: hypothetical protein IIX88_03790 [Firmicutes bacterium]|nr:hypothetical protein [Bacillota bacterium]
MLERTMFASKKIYVRRKDLMIMEITISLGDALHYLICIAILIFLFYLISVVKNLIPSAKSLAVILKDMETVSATAAEGADSAKKVVKDVSAIASEMSGVVKGNQNSLKAATNLVNSVTNLTKLMKKSK